MQRSSLLLLMLLALFTTIYIVPVHAQTISVTNPIYSSEVGLGENVDLSFTVSWSEVPSGLAILAGVFDPSSNHWVDGSMVSSAPNICQPNTEHNWADCYVQAPGSAGSFAVVFSLATSQVGQYSYKVGADIDYSCSITTPTLLRLEEQTSQYSPCLMTLSGLCTGTYSESSTFSISVVDKFTLTLNVPDQVSITLDGIPEAPGSLALRLSPGRHVISVPNQVQIDSTSRLRFDSWSDGSTQLTRTFDLERDNQVTANYITQYYVSFSTDAALTSGWYDSGITLQLSVNETPLNQYRLFTGGFDGWYSGDQLISRTPTPFFTINSPANVIAHWNYFPYLALLIAAIIAGVVSFFARERISSHQVSEPPKSIVPASRSRTRRRRPKSEALASDGDKLAVTNKSKGPKRIRTPITRKE